MAYIQCSLSAIALSWFLRLTEKYKKDSSACVSAFKQLSAESTAHYAQVEAQAFTKKKQKTYVSTFLEVNNFLKNAGAMNLLQPLFSGVLKFSLRD